MIKRSVDCLVSLFMQKEKFCSHIMLWRCHCISEKGAKVRTCAYLEGT